MRTPPKKITEDKANMKNRFESIDRWASYVKQSHGRWKNIHTEFIDAQLKKAQEFIEKLARQKGGPEKIIRLYNIKNLEGYQKLLKIK